MTRQLEEEEASKVEMMEYFEREDETLWERKMRRRVEKTSFQSNSNSSSSQLSYPDFLSSNEKGAPKPIHSRINLSKKHSTKSKSGAQQKMRTTLEFNSGLFWFIARFKNNKGCSGSLQDSRIIRVDLVHCKIQEE